MKTPPSLSARSVILALVVAFAGATATAATSRTQQIAVKAGWNAVYVEVDPQQPDPAKVFDAAKVDVVTRYFSPLSSVRVLDNPAGQSWTAPGWNVYYAASRADAFLTTLHAIQGGSAYLVHALQDTTLAVTGNVVTYRQKWMVDSYNLVGFPVDPLTPPTFADYFAGAGKDLGTTIYRLVDGSWQKVTTPASTPIRNGEAYWVYCTGSTNYQGPLELQVSSSGLDFGRTSNQLMVDYTNRLATSFGVTAVVETDDGLPLYRYVPDTANLASSSTPLTGIINLGTVAGGGVDHLRLELRRQLMRVQKGSAVLKFATSNGIVLRVPVTATAP